MKSVAILQARTNSSRLPGKVLLPLNGLPLAVLAAKRAANTGRSVVVATSQEFSDDALANVLEQHSIACYRGSLDNTLDRLVKAVCEYPDEALVFRLTGDNVFPDGELLDAIEEDFIKRDLKYLCCNGERSGLPYGMSVELTYVKCLREAARFASSSYDQEHVTPYIRRKFGEAFFERYKELGKGHFRCTIDCLDDYLGVQDVFSTVTDAVGISCFELVKRLENGLYQPFTSQPASKLVIGTAQLGLPYGIANESGAPSALTAERMLKIAIGGGASYIDTARGYGNSEAVIGCALASGWGGRARIITKLSALSDYEDDADSGTIKAAVRESVYRSCLALRSQTLDVLMLHRASHIEDWDGAVWSQILSLKDEGIIGAIGVSVQSPDELEAILDLSEVLYIQLPYNILDWRWDKVIPKIEEKKRERGIIIHARSALLQGLLVSQNADYWRQAHVKNAGEHISWLAAQAQGLSLAGLCLKYVSATEWIDGVVVGMETVEQVLQNVRLLAAPPLSPDHISTIVETRPFLEERSLNPALWSR